MSKVYEPCFGANLVNSEKGRRTVTVGGLCDVVTCTSTAFLLRQPVAGTGECGVGISLSDMIIVVGVR